MDCFHKLCLSSTPSENSQGVEILGIGCPRVLGLMQSESVPWGVMPEVFNCSVQEMRWCLISPTVHSPHFSNRTLEYLRHNFPWDRLNSHQTDNLGPSYSQDLNPFDYFLREYLKDRVCENNPQTREDFIRRKIRRIPQEMLNRFVDNFNVRVAAVLSYSSTVHGTSIVLITEKV